MLGTPCFNVFEQQKNQEGLAVANSLFYTLCAEDSREKELWLQQLQNVLARQKNV